MSDDTGIEVGQVMGVNYWVRPCKQCRTIMHTCLQSMFVGVRVISVFE
jgi:hypothetical protein